MDETSQQQADGTQPAAGHDMSHIVPICARSIPEFDRGMFGKAVDREIGLIMQDIQQRPANMAGKTETRKLKIEVAFKPIVRQHTDGSYQLIGIEMEPQFSGVIPKTVGGVTDVKIVRGKACFNREIPADFNQLPLFDDSDE